MVQKTKLSNYGHTQSGELLDTLKGHTEGVSSVAFDEKNGLLASASDDKTIKSSYGTGYNRQIN